jgi:hypothetical protein
MKRRGKTKKEINGGPRNLKGAAKSGQLLIAGLVIIIIISIVVIGSVLHSWKGQFRGDKKWSSNANVENLQMQINALKKEVAKNKTGAASTAVNGTTANQKQPAGEISSAIFEKAVNDKDFAKIETLMATKIYYVIDSSDCCGDITKKEAATNLKNYIRGAKSFNFDQNQQVVKQMKVNLADTFAKYTIGIADNKMVLSYHLDEQGKVDDLMLSSTHLMYDLE